MIRLIIPVTLILVIGFAVLVPIAISLARNTAAKQFAPQSRPDRISDRELASMNAGLKALNGAYLDMELRGDVRSGELIVDFIEAMSSAQDAYPGVVHPKTANGRARDLERRSEFKHHYDAAKNLWRQINAEG